MLARRRRRKLDVSPGFSNIQLIRAHGCGAGGGVVDYDPPKPLGPAVDEVRTKGVETGPNKELADGLDVVDPSEAEFINSIVVRELKQRIAVFEVVQLGRCLVAVGAFPIVDLSQKGSLFHAMIILHREVELFPLKRLPAG